MANIGQMFMKREVQFMLKQLARPDISKVFRRKKDGRSLRTSEFKFMSDSQLEEAQRKMKKKLWKLLQMPPVVAIKPEADEVLSRDDALQGFHTSKYLFTDISQGIKDKERFVVVRETDGTLRTAYNEECKRAKQIYFDYPGREVVPPKMFHDEYFQARPLNKFSWLINEEKPRNNEELTERISV